MVLDLIQILHGRLLLIVLFFGRFEKDLKIWKKKKKERFEKKIRFEKDLKEKNMGEIC